MRYRILVLVGGAALLSAAACSETKIFAAPATDGGASLGEAGTPPSAFPTQFSADTVEIRPFTGPDTASIPAEVRSPAWSGTRGVVFFFGFKAERESSLYRFDLAGKGGEALPYASLVSAKGVFSDVLAVDPANGDLLLADNDFGRMPVGTELRAPEASLQKIPVTPDDFVTIDSVAVSGKGHTYLVLFDGTTAGKGYRVGWIENGATSVTTVATYVYEEHLSAVALSPDGRSLYLRRGLGATTIERFALAEDGSVTGSAERLFDVPAGCYSYCPIAVDRIGNIYLARRIDDVSIPDAGHEAELSVFGANGEPRGAITLPQVTEGVISGLAFVGPNADTLLMTTSGNGIFTATIKASPPSGNP